MISMEAHVIRYYLGKSEGNTLKASLMYGVSRYRFALIMKKFDIDFRKFRKAMCYCKRLNHQRCKVCKDRNRAAAADIYRLRKMGIYPSNLAPERESPENVARTVQMLALSEQMAQMQRFLQLSK
jgi:hypothetical protein